MLFFSNYKPALQFCKPTKVFTMRVCNQVVLVFVCISCWGKSCFAQNYIQAPAAIQISSQVSDGKYTLRGIVAIAKENGIKVLVIADRDLMRWEYGIWPLRNIIKKTVEEKSIFKYGIKRYLAEIESLQKDNPDIVLIPGVESAPFYYWEGNIFDNNLKIINWHKHILTIGLETFEDYRNLPIIGNKRGLALPFKLTNIFLFWPFLILIAGILFLRNPGGGQGFGIFSVIIGLLFLANNYPFCDLKFDQYRGDLGINPYQNYFDYVKKHAGLTFWAHPEARNYQRIGKICAETSEHTYDLLRTDNYSGFAIFYEGYKDVGIPGGIWDEILKQYCRGIRKTPIWAIGALSFDSSGDLDSYMKDLRTICLITELNKTNLLKALREGGMYVINGNDSSKFILDKFVVKDKAIGIEKTLGQELETQNIPQIVIEGHFIDGQDKPIEIKLIKNGSVIKTFNVTSPFSVDYLDEDSRKGRKVYYRLEIRSGNIFLVTNPIFVKRE